jgi:hypothetical protein
LKILERVLQTLAASVSAKLQDVTSIPDAASKPFVTTLVHPREFLSWAESAGLITHAEALQFSGSSIERASPREMNRRAILSALAELKFDPKHLPRPDGRKGPRAAVREKLPTMSDASFHKAWHSLRKDGSIGDESSRATVSRSKSKG